MRSLERVSRYKAHMMGLAVMIVVYGHLLYYHADLMNYEQNHWTEWYTLGSVEIFIFLSGFGIYHSLRRNRDADQFYAKRLGRLLPSYLPVMLVWCGWNLLKGRMDFGQAVGNLTAMGWWFKTGEQFNWYVPAILILYLISPLLFDCLEKKKTAWGFAAMIVLNVAGWNSHLLMGLSRFPTYFLGMYYGKRYAEGREPGKGELAVWYAVGAVAMAVLPFFFLLPRYYDAFAPVYPVLERMGLSPMRLLWNYGMYWNLFFLASPLWMFGITWLMGLNDKFLLGRWANKMWAFLGARSFEIYLCHLALYDTLLKHGLRGWPQWICTAVAGTLIGIAFHEVVERCLKWWNGRKQTKKT